VTDLLAERAGYRVELAPDGAVARLTTGGGELALRLIAAFDTLEGPDETIAVAAPRRVGEGRFEVERRSTRWERSVVSLTCGDEAL
jgi:hypothetical protein